MASEFGPNHSDRYHPWMMHTKTVAKLFCLMRREVGPLSKRIQLSFSVTSSLDDTKFNLTNVLQNRFKGAQYTWKTSEKSFLSS